MLFLLIQCFGEISLEAISKAPLKLNLSVELKWPILEIVYYSCGCPLQFALILNPIEDFEMASR